MACFALPCPAVAFGVTAKYILLCPAAACRYDCRFFACAVISMYEGSSPDSSVHAALPV